MRPEILLVRAGRGGGKEVRQDEYVLPIGTNSAAWEDAVAERLKELKKFRGNSTDGERASRRASYSSAPDVLIQDIEVEGSCQTVV
jgi:hypothetical protein